MEKLNEVSVATEKLNEVSVVTGKLTVVTNWGSAKAGAAGTRTAVPHFYPYRTRIGSHDLLLVEYATHIPSMYGGRRKTGFLFPFWDKWTQVMGALSPKQQDFRRSMSLRPAKGP